MAIMFFRLTVRALPLPPDLHCFGRRKGGCRGIVCCKQLQLWASATSSLEQLGLAETKVWRLTDCFLQLS